MIYNLANRIKKIREDYGDNPNIAAKKVGISRTAYVKWEAGDTENMKLKNLTSFCDKYHVDVVDHPGNMQWLSIIDHQEKTRDDIRRCRKK